FPAVNFVDGNLTVTKAHLTVTVYDKSRAYRAVDPVFAATTCAFQNSQTLATSGVTGSASCGTTATATSSVAGSPYPSSCAEGSLSAAHYDFPAVNFVDGNLTVTKAHLTVTADDKSRAYGAVDPAFTATISARRSSDLLATSGVTGSASCGTTATATSSVAGSPYP